MKVRTEARDNVWIVTITRPEVRNCVDGETARALAAAFRTFDANDDLRVAVLQGEDGSFCAGADLKAVSRAKSGETIRVREEGDGPMGPTRMLLTKPVMLKRCGMVSVTVPSIQWQQTMRRGRVSRS